MIWSLGIHGGVNTSRRFRIPTPKHWLHDAAVVLCRDGRIVAAAEEERFVRIKHVNYFPLEALRFCLEFAGIELAEVDAIGLSSEHSRKFYEQVGLWELGTRAMLEPSHHEFVSGLLRSEFGDFDPSRLHTVAHHLGHMLSAVCQAGFDECLCVVLDGWGDALTGQVWTLRDGQLDSIADYDNHGPASMYLHCTQLLGYDQFDEYKVMGLAPYGDSQRFGELFERSIELGPNGTFTIAPTLNVHSVPGLPRKRGEPFAEIHQDFAAALQTATERVLLHVLRHYRESTGLTSLCLAGGLAQNCTANGRVLNSGLFDRVFVQPVAYDAGCALGAALLGEIEGGQHSSIGSFARLESLYYGKDVGGDDVIAPELDRWNEVVEVDELHDPSRAAATLLAEGKVIGWVQGRAEFGARALGNRSILADPRPAENRRRINAMVKKREAYRPFAPSVLEEYLHDYFEVPSSVARLPFMVFVVGVLPEHCELLGAITHVDGTARVQTVSEAVNPGYWNLIEHFRRLTGVPMVLNTSFNNNAEPIVNDCREALNCYVSTGLDDLVVGRYRVRKRPRAVQRCFASLVPRLNPRYLVALTSGDPQIHDRHTGKPVAIRREVFTLLSRSLTEGRPLLDGPDEPEIPELLELWQDRIFWF